MTNTMALPSQALFGDGQLTCFRHEFSGQPRRVGCERRTA